MLIILGSSSVSFLTVGFTNAFGVFQQYYIGLLYKNASAIGWIGSLNIFFLFGSFLFVGVLINKGDTRVGFLFRFLPRLGSQYPCEHYQMKGSDSSLHNPE